MSEKLGRQEPATYWTYEEYDAMGMAETTAQWLKRIGLEKHEEEITHVLKEAFHWNDIYINKVEEENKSLKNQIKLCRSTLEFYGYGDYEKTLEDRNGWLEDDGNWTWSESEIVQEGGERARTALKECFGHDKHD